MERERTRGGFGRNETAALAFEKKRKKKMKRGKDEGNE